MTVFCQTVSKCNSPPAAEIQKSWRKVDFSRISRFREAGGIQPLPRACLMEAVKINLEPKVCSCRSLCLSCRLWAGRGQWSHPFCYCYRVPLGATFFSQKWHPVFGHFGYNNIGGLFRRCVRCSFVVGSLQPLLLRWRQGESKKRLITPQPHLCVWRKNQNRDRKVILPPAICSSLFPTSPAKNKPASQRISLRGRVGYTIPN